MAHIRGQEETELLWVNPKCACGFVDQHAQRVADMSACLVYRSRMKAIRAKLFQNGGSQAVRLPAECRFPRGQREVLVRRIGHRIVLEPLNEWPEEFLKCLGTLSGELPRPKQASIAKLRDFFE
ncbi:MAG TPA: hypothetical protein VKP30_08460 [Polyangiaceae bacterium]|nr:hypothetical protein [Polyangiaceae bacterium]